MDHLEPLQIFEGLLLSSLTKCYVIQPEKYDIRQQDWKVLNLCGHVGKLEGLWELPFHIPHKSTFTNLAHLKFYVHPEAFPDQSSLTFSIILLHFVLSLLISTINLESDFFLLWTPQTYIICIILMCLHYICLTVRFRWGDCLLLTTRQVDCKFEWGSDCSLTGHVSPNAYYRVESHVIPCY